MGKLSKYLESYFENTPEETLKKHWDELSYLDGMGPTVEEYVDNVRRFNGISARKGRVRNIQTKFEKMLENLDPIEVQKMRNRMEISAKIQDTLKEKGMKQKELAEKMGVKSAAVSLLLNGNRNISIDKLSEIEYILGIRLFADYEPKRKKNDNKR